MSDHTHRSGDFYLYDVPLELAQSRFYAALERHGLGGVLREESLPLDEALCGRVLASPVWAKLSSPHYHAAAMDGFALESRRTFGAMPTQPLILSAGDQALYVDTGDPLPDWADAVVLIENTEGLDAAGAIAADPRQPHAIRIRAACPPWSHVRPMGEDIIASELVLPSGHTLRPVDLGAIAASGQGQVSVSARPRVGIIPTGSELVQPGAAVKPGDIIEYNSLVLAAQVNTWGGVARRYPITRDDFDALCAVVAQAAGENDLVLLNAGSSAGSEDFSARVIQRLGEVFVHGVAVRPGHPVILGVLNRSGAPGESQAVTPVIGVPGYPVSAALTGEIFVEPLLDRWLGRAAPPRDEVEAILTHKIVSPPGDDDYVRVVVGRVGQRLLAAPVSRGAGVITSLVRADGIAVLGRGIQGMEAGEPVKVRLYRKLPELENTIFAIGSHDMTLDLLAQHLVVRGRRLVSANVGSQGGLVALRRGEAHLAGSHLLDPQTGEYNLSYLPRYLGDVKVRVIAWVEREQGLIVKPGNPLAIHSLADLARQNVRYINRQRGAGTRVLLDFELEKLGIQPAQVTGYQQEEFTHLAVAAAVASGRGDCGLGITAAARALGLDFIPLCHERYDLIIPLEHLESGLLDPLFALMEDERFRASVAALPGYNILQMGKVIA
ncbi:MAG: molybdopterin biosynthesis protein [Anaerolineae bacterium]|nr:molybdopterin biosynthesis protein [Anaerolineae bacterium]